MGRIRVLLAEDHRQVAEQLRALLETEFEVVAVVSDGRALVESARSIKPDVVVTDITMPELDGICASEILLKENPMSRIVIITVHDDPALIKLAKEIGVFAYVVKFQCGRDLLPAVHAAAEGVPFVADSQE